MKRKSFLDMHKAKLTIRARALVNVETAELRLERLQQLLPDMIDAANLQSQQGTLQDLPNIGELLGKLPKKKKLTK